MIRGLPFSFHLHIPLPNQGVTFHSLLPPACGQMFSPNVTLQLASFLVRKKKAHRAVQDSKINTI